MLRLAPFLWALLPSGVPGAVVEVTLNGPQWTLRNDSSPDVLPAEVPGVVHLDLLRAGRIQEPYFRYGELELQWVHREPTWTYSRRFDARELTGAREVLLTSEGLDTVAEVRLNGHLVGRSENMWHRHRWPVRGLLREAGNELQVRFASPSAASVAGRDAYPAKVRGMWITPFQWPSCGACEGSAITEKCFLDGDWHNACNTSRTTRPFLRKSSAHWGWDWGGGFLTSGIYRDLALTGFSAAVITDAVVQTFPLGVGGEGVLDEAFRLEIDVFIHSVAAAGARLSATLFLGDGASNATEIDIAAGDSTARISVDVRNVTASSLWFPNGFGSPTLHTLSITLACNGEASAWTRKVGLRRVELVEEPIPGQDGLSFYFRVNGAPVFIKGANWVIQDQFEPRIRRSTFEHLLRSAAEAHFNMLRVWGGGTWERDDFYDIADEQGIMIWEEFKFGCSLYPRDRRFLASVRREVSDQVRRLSHHASVVLYSGNNENQGYISSDNYSPDLIDYSLLYDSTVQDAVRSLDRSRPYWPASPSNGAEVDSPELGVYIQRWNVAGGDSQSSQYGDSHIYPQYGSPEREATDCEDLGLFQSSRFVSEYGFIAMPSFAAVAEVTQPGDWSMNSTQIFFRNRQDWPRGQNLLLQQLGLHFQRASSPDPTEAFKDSIYLSQAVQAHCVQLSSEHFRLSRSGVARTMGLLYWSLNNQWQGQSDASLDYTGRWKLLHHAVSRFFAPRHLVLHRSDPKAAAVTAGIVNDLPGALAGRLTLELWPWAGGAPLKTADHPGVSVPGFSSRNVTEVTVGEFLGGVDPSKVFLAARFRGEAGEELAAHKFLTKLRAAGLQDPQVSVTWSQGNGGRPAATLAAARPCPWTFLDPGMLRGHFSDNGFLLLPGRPRTISFIPAEEESVSLDDLRRQSTVRTPWHATVPRSVAIV